MTLQDLGALGEIVGAVAVVLSLLYVAAPIRQNTRSLRSATSFAVNQALAELNGRWVANADGSQSCGCGAAPIWTASRRSSVNAFRGRPTIY